MRDTAFKRSLKRLPLGTGVKIDSPVGSFTLHKNSAKPAVFLAGGIGITPFFSIRTCGEFDSSRKTVKKKRGLAISVFQPDAKGTQRPRQWQR
jgi:ferredoxin-NADP reductase